MQSCTSSTPDLSPSRREDVNGMAAIAVLSDAAGKLVERPGMATAEAVLGPRTGGQ
jgi:hypothetical protein